MALIKPSSQQNSTYQPLAESNFAWGFLFKKGLFKNEKIFVIFFFVQRIGII
jgi:hypothetical protein